MPVTLQVQVPGFILHVLVAMDISNGRQPQAHAVVAQASHSSSGLLLYHFTNKLILNSALETCFI